MTRIKICGITREEDALYAAKLGADFLGFILAQESPRRVDAAHVRKIGDRIRESGHAAKIVGLFHNTHAAVVRRVAAEAAVDVVQLHGHEDDDHIRAVGIEVIKTLHVGEELPDTRLHSAASWLLFDTFHERLPGGTGRRFDWSLLTNYDRTKPFFVAGGITPENVATAISLVRPDGIDLASGVESAPGIKDHRKLEQLFERVREK